MAEAGEANRAEQLRKQVAKSRALKAQGITYEVSDSYERGERGIGKKLIAKIDGKVAGYLDLKPFDEQNKGREIRQVTTNPGFERKGVASSLFNQARRLGLKPLHSNVLSQEGRQFREAVGGRGVGPEVGPRQLEDAQTQREIRQSVSEAGRERATAIARLRAQPDPGIDISNPEIRRTLNITSPENRARFGLPAIDPFDGSRARNPQAGTVRNVGMGISPVGSFGGVLAIADFLRLANQGGRAAQGRLNLMPSDQTIGQMQ